MSKRNRKVQDLTGMTFNHLTVLEYAGDKKWRCRCSCGKEVVVLACHLKSNHTKSCGHIKRELPFEDLSGKDCRQMRIVVKARGRNNAEEICKLNGLYVAFEAGYCSETGNETEITLCDKSEAGIILSWICGLKEDIITLEQIIEVMDTDEFWRDEDV